MLYCVTEADPTLLISNSVFNKVDAHHVLFFFIYLHGVFNFFSSRYLTLMPLLRLQLQKGSHMMADTSLLCVATLMAHGRLIFNELGNVQLVYF